MEVKSLSSIQIISIFILLHISDELRCGGVELVLPAGHTALSGDLEVDLVGGEPGLGGELVLSSGGRQLAARAFLWAASGVSGNDSNPPAAALKVRFSCGLISQGGRYRVSLRLTSGEEPLHNDFDVRWPGATLGFNPLQIQTYPEVEVTSRLGYLPTRCEPAFGTQEPETWLDLLYCGHSALGCTFANATHKQLVYSEQIRGYPRLRVLKLKCELFGMAGHYALALRPSIQDPGEPIAATKPEKSLKAVWSEKFVFNVHARSIFPCDGHSGVTVLFQYPECILREGDRVRLFARLRYEVSSLAPPTSLHYVSEQRVLRGRHSLRFDCSLFSEKFVEYCFVYVSQSITGAVSDVRMDCVPTLPVADWETGGWGEWGPWTPCTSTCSGGTRNRYRFCDSPPTRYGAKFCPGHALETEECGSSGGGWGCRYYQDSGAGQVPADRPEVKAEVGPGCRCGCIVHLGTGKSVRLIAASSHSCPGRTFWLIRTERGHSVQLSMEQFRLPCVSQWLRIRDGDSSSAQLLAHLTGSPSNVAPIVSSTSALLIEFTAGDVVTSGDECSGGFLAHASQIEAGSSLNGSDPVVLRTLSPALSGWTLHGPSGFVNLGLALTLLSAVLASVCLSFQYIYRYRKYQLAAATDDQESFGADSYTSGGVGVAGIVGSRSRATSSTTLLSEVISLQRLGRALRGHSSRLPSEEESEHLTKEKEVDLDEDLEADRPTEETEKEPAAAGGKEEERRPTSLEVPKTPQLPRRNLRLLTARKFISPVSPVAEEEDGLTPKPKRNRMVFGRPSASSSQSSTLTNGSSPPSQIGGSGISSKESKEKRNRERMLAGSEFSLTAPDLEMDYYDYEVENAAPGSYLAMDPAYCLWIPPFAPGVWEESNRRANSEEEEEEPDDPQTTYKSAESIPSKQALESPVKVHISHRHLSSADAEKETTVEKSPAGSEYYELLEGANEKLKFADDDDDEPNKNNESPEKKINNTDNKTLSTVIVEVHSKNVQFKKNC